MASFGSRVLRHFGLQVRSCSRVSLFREPVHFLHIGKNAGTQISIIMKQVNAAQSALQMVKHGHRVTLTALPVEERYFFSIRDPISRFKSGFYSRKRMGMPRIYNPWSPDEARLFAAFDHANDVAEALFSDGPEGRQAMAAMLTVGHMGNSQVDWFKKGGDIFHLRPPVWIVRQERLDQDVAELLRRLGVSAEVQISRDPKASHANDYTGVPPLSEKAVENLRRWHAPDFEFYRHCEAWMQEQTAP
jgi:hypothetical protein